MLQRLLTFLMNRSLFTKIFVSISLVSMIGVFSIATVYQIYFKDILIGNEIDRVQRSINQAALNLDNQLKRIVNDMYYFFEYSETGLDLMKAEISDIKTTEDMLNAYKVLEAFQMRYSGDVESIFLIRKDEDGKERFLYDPRFVRNEAIDYRTHQWYRNFTRKQKALWSELTKEHIFYQDRSLHSVYLTMAKYDIDGRDGMIVIRLNAKMFGDAFHLLADNDLYIELIHTTGTKLFASFPPKPEESADWIAMTAPLEYSGFEVRAYVDKQSLLDKVMKIKTFRTVVVAAVFMITLVISILLSLTLVRPIRKLLKLMRHVEKGDFDVRFPTKYKDEIGTLGLGFSKMIARVSELIQRVYVVGMEKMESELQQKEATIKAMQNQINPHFLYNTLETINCLAIVHQVPSINHMSKALADFFRYSIEKQHIEVTLGEELEHVKTYLLIQAERYPDIEADLSIPEHLYDYSIIKLTLQPLIENVYYHAFTGERDYFFTVSGYEESHASYVIQIEDNGEGMGEEQMLSMMDLFRLEDVKEMPETIPVHLNTRHGIGMLNVHFRIRLRFGAPYGIELSHSDWGGLIVRVRLPRILHQEGGATA
ncbi:histidine kinase [Paenibacillus sp. GXUN7292]|uniref:sensor histidine kinase n=1 Tax=Paenibacillus sp. GXUN7292 TaxID=3422499 RepID=UPI003D7E96A6